jgi:hypothetical protein
MRILGQQLYVFSGTSANLTPIGHSTDCSLDLSADVVAGSRRGNVRLQRVGQRSWSVSVANFVVEADGLSAFLKIGQPISVALAVLQRSLVEAGVQLENVTPDGVATIIGRAYVTNIRYNGGQSLATAKMTFTGSGALNELRTQNGFTYTLPLVF